MRKLFTVAAAAAAFVAAPAFAQDMSTTSQDTTTTEPAPAVTAPDGTSGIGFEPYVAIMGGWEQFDSERTDAGIPLVPRNDKLNGALVEGIVGFNVPLGPVFVGAEGSVSKGVSGDIDWDYGAAGRFGVRAGDSGLIYGKVGYRWVNFDRFGNDSRDYHEMTYGAGFEVGPKDIGLGGITGNSGVRLRGEVSTFGSAHSFRPMLGLTTHF
ncbi:MULTISPECIES: outer membrane protein [Sphingomonas]|jgi:outer membrane immunogenic protein|uniref:Opacity protein n=1 Tax=Sphingomonas hankookensis TaxID=563996 RepID=A0ABR5YE75_9SPHN|nr:MULTISPECIES: opacity protein [Sphingomonas]KZE16319.1 opacity protein [Sphingomonas hankookensis]RSV31811.1 opacity protein [Sphingomonas sp. ABOLH]